MHYVICYRSLSLLHNNTFVLLDRWPRFTAVPALIVIAFHPRLGTLLNQLALRSCVHQTSIPVGPSVMILLFKPAQAGTSAAAIILCALPLSLCSVEGCAYLLCCTRLSTGSTSRRRSGPTRRDTTDSLLSRSSIPRSTTNPAPLVDVNSDPLSLFNYVSEMNAFITATSLFPNRNLGILEVRIFNPERTGILASFCVWVLIFLAVAYVLNYQILVTTSIYSLIAASGLLFAIVVRISTPGATGHSHVHGHPSS